MSKAIQAFPISEVRQQFPALNRLYNGKPAVYLDGPGGSQVVKSSMDAMYAYMANGGANLHGSFPSSQETEVVIAESKQAVADLFGVKVEEVAFGANMTTLTFAIARARLGADILLCSAYKFFGPHIGIAVIREGLFEQLEPYKLAPAPAYIPDKLETGTQNHEGIAGIKPAIEFIASLGTGSTRNEQIRSGLEFIEVYENELALKLRRGLSDIDGVTLYQAGEDVLKTPTVAFRVTGFEPREICRRMAEEHGVFIADGDFYATTLADKLGINQSGGWIRAGFAPYNTEEEVERLIEGIIQIVNE